MSFNTSATCSLRPHPTGDQPHVRIPSSPNFWVGVDVHKESVAAVVLRNRDPDRLRVDRLPYDLKEIRG